jgi:hypothetical protein
MERKRMSPLSEVTHQDHRSRLALLAMIAGVSVLLWQTTIGSLALYPFTILATWFHEMGHGLAAVVLGSRFDHLMIYSDGSGYAAIMSRSDQWGVTDAVISASGPFGPAVAGSLLILASRSPQRSAFALKVLGAAILLSTLVWVRSLAGWLVLPAVGCAILALGAWTRPSVRVLAVQILGVQACISVWQQFDYLFSDGGFVGGQAATSDTSAIARALILPYWFWGGAISVVIVVMLALSFRAAFRRT